MKEKTLFKIAILCTVVGLLVLFFFSSHIEVDSIDVSRIDATDIDSEVRVVGKVLSVSSTEKVMFLSVGQEKIEDVDVVLFKDSDDIDGIDNA